MNAKKKSTKSKQSKAKQSGRSAKADRRVSKGSKRAKAKSTSKQHQVTSTAASSSTTSNAKDPGSTVVQATRRTGEPVQRPPGRGVSDTRHTADTQAVDDRVGSHTPEDGLLFWLTVLLTHVAEQRTGTSWQQIVIELGRVHAVTVSSNTGSATYSTALTAEQRRLMNACDVAEPPRVAHLPPT